MKKEALKNLHCGACGIKFKSFKKLHSHIQQCPVAKIILLHVNYALLGGQDFAHKFAHFVAAVHKNVHLIKQYALTVANDMDSFTIENNSVKITGDE